MNSSEIQNIQIPMISQCSWGLRRYLPNSVLQDLEGWEGCMANCSECQAMVRFGKLMYAVLNLILGLLRAYAAWQYEQDIQYSRMAFVQVQLVIYRSKRSIRLNQLLIVTTTWWWIWRRFWIVMDIDEYWMILVFIIGLLTDIGKFWHIELPVPHCTMRLHPRLEDAGALRDAYIPSMEKVKAAIQVCKRLQVSASVCKRLQASASVCKRQLTVKLLLSELIQVYSFTQAEKQLARGSTKLDPLANQR